MYSERKFYDDFADRQVHTGINHRHLSIQRWLERLGLKQSHSVLEVGCGVGTLTELILRYLSSSGSLCAVDFSVKSIDIAREKLAKYKNVEFITGNITDIDISGKFDVIVLPDVIEHIPLEQHATLFGTLASLLYDTGFILVHIPDPFYLEWCRENRKQELQIIDQPIYLETIAKNTRPHNLSIEFIKSYSIYSQDPDYRVMVLKPQADKRKYDAAGVFLNDSWFRRGKKKINYFLRGFK